MVYSNYSNYKTFKFQFYLIAHVLAIGTLTIYDLFTSTSSSAFLHEQRKVLQPVRQVQWVTPLQALGIGSKLGEWDAKVCIRACACKEVIDSQCANC